jgi:hypothetical protein
MLQWKGMGWFHPQTYNREAYYWSESYYVTCILKTVKGNKKVVIKVIQDSHRIRAGSKENMKKRYSAG